MATPCSAPFLGSAVGFALGQSTPIIFAIFLAVGFGMALPYLTLAVFPGAARILPRPGAWMDTFKGLMGFLLAGAAIWLFYVLAAQLSTVRLALVQLVLLAMALCAWLLHRATSGGLARRVYGLLLLVCAVAAPFVASAGQDRIGADGTSTNRTLAARNTQHLIDWQPWDEATEQRLLSAGRCSSTSPPTGASPARSTLWSSRRPKSPRLQERRRSGATRRLDQSQRHDRRLSRQARSLRHPFYLAHVPGQEPRVLTELLTRDAVLAAIKPDADLVRGLSRGAPPLPRE